MVWFSVLRRSKDSSDPLIVGDSQDDFWGSKNQLALVFCAALSFFVLSFLKTSGWKGFLKTCAISYLCFQVFTLTSIYDSIYTQHCLFPQTIADAPKKYLIGFAIVGLIISAIATGIFTALRSVFKRFMALLFPVKNEFTDLDLNKK